MEKLLLKFLFTCIFIYMVYQLIITAIELYFTEIIIITSIVTILYIYIKYLLRKNGIRPRKKGKKKGTIHYNSDYTDNQKSSLKKLSRGDFNHDLKMLAEQKKMIISCAYRNKSLIDDTVYIAKSLVDKIDCYEADVKNKLDRTYAIKDLCDSIEKHADSQNIRNVTKEGGLMGRFMSDIEYDIKQLEKKYDL